MENGSASSPSKPHFFKPLLPGFHSQLNIPIAFFSKYIKGTRNEGKALVKLRPDASDLSWEVKLDGQKLTQGWQKFATSHDLKVGDIVIFRHDGDLLFHVTCFGPSCCEIQYNNDNDDDNVIQISSDSDSDSDSEWYQSTREEGSESEWYQSTREERSSSHQSCFVARVTASNLDKDMLYLPIDFTRSNGLMNRKCEIILLNEDGKPWTLFLTHHESHGQVYIKNGWKKFCLANRKRVHDSLTFEILESTTTPVLRECYRASTSSTSTSQKRFLTLTLKPYMLKSYNLYLPGAFVKSNGIQDARMITLVDRYGIKKTTSLIPQSRCGKMRIGKGWREFCEANGVKTGESFKLELIKKEEDRAAHVLKFCSKVLNSP